MINFNNIKNLSKIFILDNDQYLNLIDKKNKTINKKSFMAWIILILIFAISWLSQMAMKGLIKVGKPEIFLNGYFLFMQILIIIQSIMLCTNIFYFSKDIEDILFLPIKPIEILISKINTLIFILYNTETILGLIPFSIYGIYTNMGLLFYIRLIIVLLIFPIFSAVIVSIFMICLINILKFVKNKDLLQIVTSFILIGLVMGAMFSGIKYILNSGIEGNELSSILNTIDDNIIKINKYFIVINPCTNILKNNNIFFNSFKLLIYNIIIFIPFLFIGKKFYLNQLLKTRIYTKNKKIFKNKINKKIKKNKTGFAYIKKEFKMLFKNPLFFIQCVYPVIIFAITIFAMLFILIPRFRYMLTLDEYKDLAKNIKFDIEVMCIILGLLQVIGLFNRTSITAFSREGKSSYTIKYLPINLYKQFIYKNIPQIFTNTIISISVILLLHFKIPEISVKYMFIIFIISFLLYCINSFILVLIDLINPKINWESQYELLKNNHNKLLQYVLIVLNILFLIYIKNIFEETELNLAIFILLLILILFFIIINLIINKYKNKIFRKIN